MCQATTPKKFINGDKGRKKTTTLYFILSKKKKVLVKILVVVKTTTKNNTRKTEFAIKIRASNSQKILTRTPLSLSLSLSHHERDDEEKTREGEKETRVFRSGRRLLERGASIFLDDKNCDFDDDDDDGRAALGVVR